MSILFLVESARWAKLLHIL